MARKKRQFKTNTVILTAEDKKDQIRREFYRACAFEESLDLDEWSDQYRVLPQETSSEYGQWSTARFPFLKRIMKMLSPSSRARLIVVMKGAQLGFTEMAINWILYNSVCRPGPMMYVQKTDDAAEDFSKQKLKPSIDACEAVLTSLGREKPKGYANSWDNKAYPGGFCVIGGASSSAFLRSKSIRDAIVDEEDSFDANVDKEGSGVALIQKRMVNFPDRKMYRLSTPVLDELSTIKHAYEAGSEEKYYVPCPHCNPEANENGFMFTIEWDNIHWTKELDPTTNYPKEVWLECPHCAEKIIEDQYKTWMLTNGDWFSMKNSHERYRVGDVLNPSFHISSLYSPAGFFSWADAVGEWFDYLRSNDQMLLQVFINQTLAQTFSLTGQEISYNNLYNRRERYSGMKDDFDVPSGALCLTAGVDVQKDRIECEVVGWGELEENWSVDYAVFPGDPGQKGNRDGMLHTGQPSVWRLLDEYLMKRYVHESGALMPVEVTMVDTGYASEEVHLFCRVREHRRVYPIKGDDGWRKGYWSRAKRRHERWRTVDYTAMVDELKSKLYAQLQIDEPGPGYCHFPRKPAYSKEHFKGLTCESRKTKIVSGKKKLYWETPAGARNEPIDCRNYAQVGFLVYPVNLKLRAKDGLLSIFPCKGGISPAKTRGYKRRRKGHPGL